MVVTSSSRSGAHVTLAFTVHSDSDEPLEQGSYGVGLCLEAGLSTSCRSDPSKSMGVTVIINGQPSDEELCRFGRLLRRARHLTGGLGGPAAGRYEERSAEFPRRRWPC